MVGSLYVSNLTSEGFLISWNGTQGHVDGYVLEIIDSEWLMEPREHNISGDVQSYSVTGLRPSTDYVAYLYGVSKGSRTNAVSSVASTGTSHFPTPTSLLSVFILRCKSSETGTYKKSIYH